MTPNPPRIVLQKTADYRETYANSVQIRVNLWDFYLMFGTINQNAPEHVEIQNFQGVYLSPQQAKALLGLMQQNVEPVRSGIRRNQTGATGRVGLRPIDRWFRRAGGSGPRRTC